MRESSVISLIDDDAIYQLLTRKMVEVTGYFDTILQFTDGQEALDYIVEHQHDPAKLPDLILLDLEMPYVDGWQFLEQYLALPITKKIIIYIVSSSINLADQERAKQINEVQGFIIKPISKQQFLEALNSLKTI